MCLCVSGVYFRLLLGMCCDGVADVDVSGQGLSVAHVDQSVGMSLDQVFGPPPQGRPSEPLAKYWSQRYRLFSRFDQGVLLDEGESGARCWAGGHLQLCLLLCLQRGGFRPHQRRLPSTWLPAVSVTSSSMPSVEWGAMPSTLPSLVSEVSCHPVWEGVPADEVPASRLAFHRSCLV